MEKKSEGMLEGFNGEKVFSQGTKGQSRVVIACMGFGALAPSDLEILVSRR